MQKNLTKVMAQIYTFTIKVYESVRAGKPESLLTQ